MTQTTNTPTVEGDGATVCVAAEAYNPNTDEALMTGTRHILVDGCVLCGNRHVEANVEDGTYHVEESEYPTEMDACERCAKSYNANYESADPIFEQAKYLEEADWVEIHTSEQTYRGRVQRQSTRSGSMQIITVVISDEPQRRWVYGAEDRLRLVIREGERKIEKRTGETQTELDAEIESLEPIDPPKGNIDKQTETVISDIQSRFSDVEFGRYGGVGVAGPDIESFDIQFIGGEDTLIEGVLGKLKSAGYTVEKEQPADEDSNYTRIVFSADINNRGGN